MCPLTMAFYLYYMALLFYPIPTQICIIGFSCPLPNNHLMGRTNKITKNTSRIERIPLNELRWVFLLACPFPPASIARSLICSIKSSSFWLVLYQDPEIPFVSNRTPIASPAGIRTFWSSLSSNVDSAGKDLDHWSVLPLDKLWNGIKIFGNLPKMPL